MWVIRIQRILGTALAAGIVLVFVVTTLLFSLQEPTGGAGGVPSWLGIVALLAASIFVAELARVMLVQAFAVRGAVVAAPPRSPWARLGRLGAYLGLPVLLVMLLGVIGLLILVSVGLADQLRTHGPNLPLRFNLVVLVYLVYATARRQLVAIFGAVVAPLRERVRSLTPTYEVRDQSILLDLKRKRRGQPAMVQINFDELDELRVLSRAEAGLFMTHQVGPDPGLAVRGTSDLVQYFSGAIERPSVYRDTAHGTFPVLLLRGAELFYLISIANADPQAVEQAFEVHKQPSGSTPSPDSP